MLSCLWSSKCYLFTLTLACKVCLGSRSLGILLIRPNHITWDLSIWRSSDSMLSDSRTIVSRSLSNIIIPLMFRKNLISDAGICDRTQSVNTQNSWSDVRTGTNIDLNTESFAFLDKSSLRMTKWCKARIIALALPDRTSNSSFCHPSLWTRPPNTWTSPPVLMILRQLAQNIGRDFSKDGVPQFWKCWFSFQQCHMQLQSHLMVMEAIYKGSQQN